LCDLDLVVNGRVILDWVLRKSVGTAWAHWSGSGDEKRYAVVKAVVKLLFP
jgi:hypothetical protein